MRVTRVRGYQVLMHLLMYDMLCDLTALTFHRDARRQ